MHVTVKMNNWRFYGIIVFSMKYYIEGVLEKSSELGREIDDNFFSIN